MNEYPPSKSVSMEFGDEAICNLYFQHLGSPSTKNTHALLVATKNPTPMDFETDFKNWYGGFTCAAQQFDPQADLPSINHVIHLIASNIERGRKLVAA